jgi:uncharacterized membrane protein YkvA (DUF1232 family)
MWWRLLLGVAAGLVVVDLLLVTTLWVASRNTRDTSLLRESLRLLPDVVRLLRRLTRDPQVPRGVRIRLGLLIVYLMMPIDLIPDFIPVIGYADDALIVAIALRSVIRHAGVEAIDRHWPGSADGLAVIHRLAGTGRVPHP